MIQAEFLGRLGVKKTLCYTLPRMRAKWPKLLLILIFVLLLPGIYWGLPSAISSQVDAPLPLGSLIFFADRRPDIDIVYPAFHSLFMIPFYGVAFVIYRVMGGFSHLSSSWPYGFRDVSGFFTSLAVITNLVSAVMGTLLLAIALFFVEARKAWAWFALLFMGTNAIFVYYSRVGNLDIPYNFWLAVMLLFVWQFLIKGQPLKTSLIPAGVAAALAIGSKDQAVGMAIGICVVLLCIGPRSLTPWRERLGNTIAFGSTLVGTYALVAILPNANRWWHHLKFVTGPHAPTPIPMTPYGQIQILLLTLDEVIQAFTVPIIVLCVIGAWQMFRTGLARQFWILVAPQIGYYLIVIAKTRVAYPRFMIPFIIPVFVLTTYGIAWIADRLPQSRPVQLAWLGLLGSFLLGHAIVSYGPVTYAQVFDLKRKVAADIPSLVPAGSPLLIARMQATNFPNRDLYEKYRLMMIPGDPIRPPSRHASNIFYPLTQDAGFFLLGSGGSGLPWHEPIATPPLSGELVKEWRYPKWVRDHLRVPVLYEFFLYRRTGPFPVDWVAPLEGGNRSGPLLPSN